MFHEPWVEVFPAYGYLRLVCDELQIYINCTNISNSKRIRYIKGNSPISDLKILCVHRDLLFQSLFTFFILLKTSEYNELYYRSKKPLVSVPNTCYVLLIQIIVRYRIQYRKEIDIILIT